MTETQIKQIFFNYESSIKTIMTKPYKNNLITLKHVSRIKIFNPSSDFDREDMLELNGLKLNSYIYFPDFTDNITCNKIHCAGIEFNLYNYTNQLKSVLSVGYIDEELLYNEKKYNDITSYLVKNGDPKYIEKKSKVHIKEDILFVNMVDLLLKYFCTHAYDLNNVNHIFRSIDYNN